MPDYPVVDMHTHLWRSVQAGQRAFWRNPHPAVIPYTGTPEDHLHGMADAGVAYCAGIAVTDGRRIEAVRELGLVSQVFDEATLTTLEGVAARR